MLSCNGRKTPVFRKGDTVLGASGGDSTVGRWGPVLVPRRGRVLADEIFRDGVVREGPRGRDWGGVSRLDEVRFGNVAVFGANGDLTCNQSPESQYDREDV